MELMLLLVTEGSVYYKKLLEFTGTHAVIGTHRLQEITKECVTMWIWEHVSIWWWLCAYRSMRWH